MPTDLDAARPSKSFGGTSFVTNAKPTAADWNGDPDTIYTAFNTAAARINTHASRHATGGADVVTPQAIGAAPQDFAFYAGGG